MSVRLLGVGGRSRRIGGIAFVVVALVAALGLSATLAHAASFQRPLKEVFGSAEQPTFSSSSEEVVAFDPNTGDLLVGEGAQDSEGGAQTISRYHVDGTPAPFSALGSNVIDGKRGSGGHTRAECESAPEPESCDETPQNGLVIRQPLQIAVDGSAGPTNGDIYVTQAESNVVDIFSREGKYLGQLTGSNLGALDTPTGVAVGPTGEVYVAVAHSVGDGAIGEIVKFVPSGNPVKNTDSVANFPAGRLAGHILLGSGPSAGFLFVASGFSSGLSWSKVNEDSGQATEFLAGEGEKLGTLNPTSGDPILALEAAGNQEALEFDGSQVSATNPLSRLVPGQKMRDFVANPSGEIYAASGEHILVYGQPVPVATVTANAPTNVTGTKATLHGSVNPSGLEVTDCFFEWGPTSNYGHKEPCEGTLPPTDSEDHAVHLRISGLAAEGETYHFRVGATDEHGTETSADRTFTTAHIVVTEPATEITAGSATLNGTVRPEGAAFAACEFEWGVSSRAGYEHHASCAPTAEELEAGFTAQPVTALLTGLQPGTVYRFRVTTDRGDGEAEEFSTRGAPRISEVRALNATQTSAQLEAKVNPSGFRTSYRFEWGPTTAYGNVVPAEIEPSLGDGTSRVLVTASLSSLSTATTYHYRVVATNQVGTTHTADHEVETLNSCAPVGLPDHRCFELVSPRALGSTAGPGRGGFSAVEMHYQAAEGSGALAYFIEAGQSDATKGGEVLYRASRSATDGWNSSVLNPPTTRRNEETGSTALPNKFFGLSSDLSCGVVGSSQPLSEDPQERAVAQLQNEAGGANLYVRDASGSYKLITDVPPEELGRKDTISRLRSEFQLYGLSANCGTVVFSSPNHYSGAGGVGSGDRLYEWRRGVGLRYLGWVPSGSVGEVEVEASAGDGNVVSGDGSRVFFMAPDVAEGGRGVFVRENGTVTHDLSASETTIADSGATYQGATPDGSRAYFTANAGLTSVSNSEGTDLYEYNFGTSSLKDLSVTPEPGGAEVEEVVGIAANGSHAYFTSTAQLVPGRGKTSAQNQNGGTLSLYDSVEGTLHFVATVSGTVGTGAGVHKTTRVSPTGRYLLFQSDGNVTGYEGGDIPQAYLYDAEDAAEPTVCVSCRQDGAPTVRLPNTALLPTDSMGNPEGTLYEPQSLVVKNGAAEVFFVSRDRLATGAKQGTVTLYEWSHGQVFAISTEPEGYGTANGTGEAIEFAGASADGEDLYFYNPAALNWENHEGRYAAWDARVGGGFPEPPHVPAPCDPTAEEGSGSCHVPAAAAPVSSTAGTTGFNGEGNVKPNSHKKKHHKKKHHKKKHHKKKHQGKARHASRDRGAGK